MTNTQKLQEMLQVSWFNSEVTENRHISIKERLTVTEDMASELVKELEDIMTMATLGEEPTPLQKLAFQLLKKSF